jgi:tetratricopeptide (TPR) repeat protein
MGWHLPFDRAGRCLTRGQRALARRDFAAAETLLREAVARDARSAHAYLYLAHALAEQERLSEAEATLERAGALAPENFVFPLHLAIVRLDADRRAPAREALTRAAQLAPDNTLVAGYSHLVTWDDGGRRGLEALRHRAHDLPESFRARLLLRLVATMLRARGGKDALALIEPTPDPPIVIPLPRALRDRWRRRRLARARRLADAGRSEDAADYLAGEPDALTQPGARELLEGARRGAVASLTMAIERAQPREQRPLLLRRYEYENDLGDRDAAYATLQAWLAPSADTKASASETPIVEAATRRLAELDIERGDYERAQQHCAASRAARPARETHGVEAVALVGLGRHRSARHRFEDFIADALFPIEASVGRVLDSPA